MALLDFATTTRRRSLSVSSDTVEVKPESATQNTFNTDLWGGFTAATGNSSPSPAEAKSINSENWINFFNCLEKRIVECQIKLVVI
ncbi:hypothetical protein CEXT_174441 [Caerostris extrusa]|uniref:Uncharacterized protein n=1 Tax=Caerostris extrusa TaxID=172846 RepID=A0AAV4XQ12_CAEEX|nr:hypothetical protein CEXT_174441 [Caerostris extrusa]